MGIQIKKILLNGMEPAFFSFGEAKEHLGTPLTIQLQPDTRAITIEYATVPSAEALQWLEPAQTEGKNMPFLFTQSQATLARTWVPCQDTPGVRFTYEARVKVPAGMLALMSARNPRQINQEGIYNFTMEHPIPSYLLALACGDIAYKTFSERTGVYCEPNLLEKATYEFAGMEEMVQAAEALYGNYRWEQFDVLVLPPSFPFGGMENPRLTFATPTLLAGDRSLVNVIAHELAHSWSGNLVTNATWNDFWLNEGFTVYFERRIIEHIEGKAYAEMLANIGYHELQKTLLELGDNSIDTCLKLDLQGRNADEGCTLIAYEKGYFMLCTIEKVIGRDAFDKFLNNYFAEFGFQSITTEEFITYFNTQIIKDNSTLKSRLQLKKWIYQPGLPAGFIPPVSARFGKVESELRHWLNGQSASSLVTAGWSSHEWLHLLQCMPERLSKKQLDELDHTFCFSDSGNAEILVCWLELCLKNNYLKVLKVTEDFLMNVGRRKFLLPLYKALLQNNATREHAVCIYTKARERYHFVATNTLDKLLAYKVKD
jgi:aminopeptidase N